MLPDTPRPGKALDVGRLVPDRRVEAWADTLYDKYYPLEVDFLRYVFDFGRLIISDVADLRFGRIHSDPFIVHRRRRHISRRTGDYYLIPIPARSPLQLRQRGRAAVVAPGDLALVGTCEAYTYEQRTRNEVLTLRIPGALLRERIGDIDDHTARSFPAGQPAVALFADYARSLARHGAGLEKAEARTAARALLDLLAITILAPGEGIASGETAVRVAHRQRALRLIDARLGDPALKPSFVVQTLGISERYLQQIFAEHGQSLSSVIRARRIGEAKRLLSEVAAPPRGIASIAYSVGFSDPAHFSRVFLAEAGLSPKAYRKQAAPPSA